ncbi:creatininase [Acidocella aquatica]|uniref:Creatininase n=1 Tax=Acidocella aquatica TaxID=1922313 RepID=A0ABQ6A7L9_9PROT|nr:creatininase family protein [Acidocella aquatica]GLR66198.1 creatininase [Acidocella aquatica]
MSDSRHNFRLGDMTATTFAQAAASNPVVLLPLGSHEDHGSHLPMGDYLLAEQLAVSIAEAATGKGVATFVAPCLPFGVADYFGATPGGLALSPASFRAVLYDLLAGLLRHGLSNIIILNGHGGNVPVIHEVALEVRHKHNIILPSFYLWKIARQLMEAQLGAGSQERFGHGAEPLLSLTKALREGFVQPGGAAAHGRETMLGLPVSGFGTLDFYGLAIDAPVEFDQVPRGATEAAWPLASAELGAQTAESLISAAAQFAVHFGRLPRGAAGRVV